MFRANYYSFKYITVSVIDTFHRETHCYTFTHKLGCDLSTAALSFITLHYWAVQWLRCWTTAACRGWALNNLLSRRALEKGP